MARSKTARSSVSTKFGGTATLRSTSSQTAQATAPVKITREQIARRAHEIWVKNGCRHGQDEQNWLEAERQLMAEACK